MLSSGCALSGAKKVAVTYTDTPQIATVSTVEAAKEQPLYSLRGDTPTVASEVSSSCRRSASGGFS